MGTGKRVNLITVYRGNDENVVNFIGEYWREENFAQGSDREASILLALSHNLKYYSEKSKCLYVGKYTTKGCCSKLTRVYNGNTTHRDKFIGEYKSLAGALQHYGIYVKNSFYNYKNPFYVESVNKTFYCLEDKKPSVAVYDGLNMIDGFKSKNACYKKYRITNLEKKLLDKNNSVYSNKFNLTFVLLK